MSFYKFYTQGIYPQFLFNEDEGEDGGGTGGGGSDDDNGGEGGDDGKMIDMDKIKGEDQSKNDDQKEGKDEKPQRPEDIPEKFWDPEKGEVRVEAMNKAYKDLEAKLSNKGKAPDEYKLELDDEAKKIFGEEAADKDPLISWFKEYAKENNFTQEMFDSAFQGFAAKAAEVMAANAVPEIDQKAEREKLGKDASAIIKNHTDFLQGMYKRGEVNDEQMQEILILTETAAGMQALSALRAHYGEKQNIPLNLKGGGGAKSSAELQAMMADPKYGQDTEYTSMVDAEYEKKYGSGNSGESQRTPLY